METTDVSDPSFDNQYPTLIDFESRFRQKPKPGKSVGSKAINSIKNYFKNVRVVETLLSRFPIIDTLANYDVKGDLLSDVIAGIMAGVTMIPQSMAFATLSTLPHYVGLYMSFFAPLTYFLFGTSRHLAWGCVAIVSIMMSDVMYKYDHSDDAKSFIERWNATHDHHSHSHNLSAYHKDQLDLRVYQNLYEYISNGNDEMESYAHIEKLREAIDERRIEVACGVTVMIGMMCIVASLIGFHRISTVMSNSLITGFTVGISFHIATSQVKGILGLSVRRYTGNGRIFRTWAAIFEHISDTRMTALVISLICMLIIYLIKKFVNERYKHKLRVPIPVELFVVIGGILVSYYMNFINNHKVKVVGKVPSGIPAPKIPDLSLSVDYIGDGVVMVIVSYAQSLAMAKTMALDHAYGVDPKQEMFATGICTTVSGFFSGYIPGGSVSISLIQTSAGGKTRVASLFSATIVLLVILVLGQFVKYLPTCVMAAIILVNLRSMFTKLLRLPKEWRTSKYDCAVWVFACIVTIALDTGIALLAGILFSIFLVMFRSMIKPLYEIGRIKLDPSSFELRSLDRYVSIQKLAAVRLIKIKTPLLFFNADIFMSSVIALTGIDPVRIKSMGKSMRKQRKVKSNGTSSPYDKLDEVRLDAKLDVENNEALPVCAVKVIVLDIAEVAFVDVMGVQALETVIREFGSIRIDVLISAIPENIFDILQSTGFWDRHQKRLYLNVSAALASLPATIQKYKVYGESEDAKSTESVY